MIRFFSVLIVLCYVPVALVYVGVIPFTARFTVLVVVALFAGVLSRVAGYSWCELGFRKDMLKTSLLWNGVLSAALVILMYALFTAGLIREPRVPVWSWFFVFYVFISSPAQEFIYRSVVFALMNRAGIVGAVPQVLISAITFSFLHCIYRDWATMVVTLFIGIVWGVLYRRHPNIAGVTLSHAVLGIVSFATGIL